MSVGGPSPLGTLLVQRLDAVLGTTLSQQANIVTGARPDAVSQAANAERAESARNETLRHPRDVVDRATAHTEQNARNAVDKARLEARNAALLLARGGPNTASTPSAPTTLGYAARTILALLAGYPDLSASVQGRQPLLDRSAQQGGAWRGNAGTATGTGGSASQPSGTQQPTATDRSGRASGAAGPGNAAAANTATSAGGRAGAAATAVASGTPLQGNAPVAGQLAAALSQAVQGSGMFYEAHLAGLAFGKFSLAQLVQEPQAQIGRNAAQTNIPGNAAGTNASAAGNPGSSTANAAASPGATSAAPAGADAANAATAGRGAESAPQAAGPAAGNTTPAGAIPGLDPQAHTLVRQQLEVLANQTFGWRGEAWPGAEMDWEISRREPQGDDAVGAADHWATRLTLNLPGLGQVQARLSLAGKQLVMHLVSPQSAELLDAHAKALRSRYSAQGLQLSQLSIVSESAPEAADNDTAPTFSEQRHEHPAPRPE